MSPEDFRKWGHQVVDWIANYQETVKSLPVLSKVKPGDVRRSLPPQPPFRGEAFEQIMSDVDRLILPGITHWQSPNFFAYFPANTSGPSILGELLSAGLGVQGMLWATSPACTELETHVLDWMADMVGLPEHFKSSGAGGGVIQDSASSAVLCAVLAARERATAFQTNERGAAGHLVAYTSPHAHSSVEKAIMVSGVGRERLRRVKVDHASGIDPDDLLRLIKADREHGLVPFFVSATVGSTSSNASDPLVDLGRICRHEGLWMHADAAMCGSAMVCPEFRHLLNGIEFADSYAFNPHKWLFTNFDCDCFYVADRRTLIRTLSILPEYLRNQASESGEVIDYRDWQVPLGRRFRALKLWFVIRHYGVEGLQYHIRRHVELAQQFSRWVECSSDFELTAEAPLNLVCFAHKAGDEFNRKLLEELNQSGQLFLSHAVLDGRYTLRFCVGQTQTEFEHVERAWTLIQAVARNLQ